MKKKTIILLLCLILIIPIIGGCNFSGCNTVIVGKFCNTYKCAMCENDSYIVFSMGIIYDKKNNTFVKSSEFSTYEPIQITMDETSFTISDFCYEYVSEQNNVLVYLETKIIGYDGLKISGTKEFLYEKEYKYTFLEEGFYSSYQRTDWDKEELSSDESKIWAYCKSKSLKKEFPYLIEGKCQETKDEIYFNVNVYNKIMWKGSGLVNQGVVSSTLNKYNKTTGEITEIISYNGRSIRAFEKNWLYYYEKSSDAIYFQNHITKQSICVVNPKEFMRYFLTEKYVLVENSNQVPYTYSIISLT